MEKVLLDTEAAWVQENDVEADYDGGRVVLVAQTKELQKQENVQLVTLVLNFTEDEPMREYAVTRPERASRRYRIVVSEVEE